MAKNKKLKNLLKDIELVIFDMDGTIYQLDGEGNGFENSTLHKKVIANSLNFIAETEKCNLEEARSVLDNALKDNVGISRFLAKRYNISREDYFNICWNIDPEGVLKEHEVAVSIIKESKVNKMLVTAAPKAWQSNVFRYVGFTSKHFLSVYTGETYDSKEDVFRSVIESYRPERVLSVGDQMETDIEPAEKLGMRTFLVKSPSDLAMLIP